MPFLFHFRDWLYVVWFLVLAIPAPKSAASEVRGTRRERTHSKVKWG